MGSLLTLPFLDDDDDDVMLYKFLAITALGGTNSTIYIVLHEGVTLFHPSELFYHSALLEEPGGEMVKNHLHSERNLRYLCKVNSATKEIMSWFSVSSLLSTDFFHGD